MTTRAALINAEPQHPGFFEMAQRHRYPLRHLDTTELPSLCDLGSQLVEVQVVHSLAVSASVACSAMHSSNPECAQIKYVQVPSSMTSLKIPRRRPLVEREAHPPLAKQGLIPMSIMLQGVGGLRTLSCPVRTPRLSNIMSSSCGMHRCAVHATGQEDN